MKDYQIQELEIKNVVVGTGAAGYGTALELFRLGETNTAILSEDILSGTSRNTGSDKQTYYKLTLAGNEDDSVMKMAEDLFAGQCVDGDQALCEAALSARGFYNLVELGVPFPCNEFGEYMGYKTDHDRGKRATSVGPYTSKMMTECLEREVIKNQIPIYDHLQVIRILANEGKVRGLLCLDTSSFDELSFRLLWCQNIVYATGGPAGMYHDSVYPGSQIGSSGIAFEAGAKGKNLTEWQFGMASTNPRWNVSGTYMQVLPRFVSTDKDGKNQREFLCDYFDDPYAMLSNIFLKGYQWPFDTNKAITGSSIIDLLVYQETIMKNRRVFLDFKNNPGKNDIDFSKLSIEANAYLNDAGACFGTPIERLALMNQPAIDFYLEHGVDLSKELLEIAICAQHNNGGLATNSHWETNIKGLYAVGEVCGSHGVTRPGGSALNAGQVGSIRVAEAIAFPEMTEMNQLSRDEYCRKQALDCIQMFFSLKGNQTVAEIWNRASIRMSRSGGMIRNIKDIAEALQEAEIDLSGLATKTKAKAHDASMFYHLYDMLLAQKVYLSAMKDYVNHGCESRGSALYTSPDGEKASEKLPDLFACQLDEGRHRDVIQEVQLVGKECHFTWRPVREIPKADSFFENQWRSFRKRRGL